MGVTTIDERGRIVIPKELREKYGLKEGMHLEINATSIVTCLLGALA